MGKDPRVRMLEGCVIVETTPYRDADTELQTDNCRSSLGRRPRDLAPILPGPANLTRKKIPISIYSFKASLKTTECQKRHQG